MPLDDRLHAVGLGQQFVPLVVAEFDRRLAGRPAVVVQRPAPDPLHQVFVLGCQRGEETLCPLDFIAVRPRGDEVQRYAHARRPGRVAPEGRRVFLGRHFPTAAPPLVAYAPEVDVERVVVAGLLAQFGQRSRARWRVAVVDPLVEIFGWQAAHVAREVRFRAGHPAQPHEFVGAERIRLELLRAAGLLGEAFDVHPEVGPRRP